jgi:hypothetical protein
MICGCLTLRQTPDDASSLDAILSESDLASCRKSTVVPELWRVTDLSFGEITFAL